MVSQLVHDFIHLKGCQDRLDQHRSFNGTLRNPQFLLRQHEYIIPETRLPVIFELGQVKVRTCSLFDQLLSGVKEVQAKIKDATGNRLAINQSMLLYKMPAARAYQQRRDLLVESVLLSLWADELDWAIDCIAHIDLTLNRAFPGWGKRIFKVGHKDFRARVQGVDNHFSFNRPSNLYTAILQVSRHRRDGPFAIANMFSLGQEIGHLACVDLSLSLYSPL